MNKMPEGAPKLEELLVDTAKMPWREKSLKGISEKMLWRNEETGASIAMIRFAKGAGIPQPHFHASNQFMICLSGKYEYTATGVVYAELGFAPPLCRGLFVLSRSVGALAHAYEEMQSGERTKGPIPRHLIWNYTGPPPRDVPEK